MDFPKNELIDMVYILGEAGKNCLLVVSLYGAKYPNRHIPSRKSFQCLMEGFDGSGNVEYTKRKEINQNVTNEGKEMEILLHVEDHSQVSSRQLADLSDTTQSMANDTTRKYNYHPLHMDLHQELQDRDFERRVNFYTTINGAIEADLNFLSKVMFSDEATFRSNGTGNSHNMHYDLPQLLEEINNFEREQMWILQDGAPAHYHREVQDFLNDRYPQKWIGRDGFIQKL